MECGKDYRYYLREGRVLFPIFFTRKKPYTLFIEKSF